MKGNPKLPFLIAVAFAVAVITALVRGAARPTTACCTATCRIATAVRSLPRSSRQTFPKFADAGGAILVPSNQVHETRLKLAAMGLPKGGSVGFELMDNQKFGISQFAEQINYQRALEGELQRTIESINAVRRARASRDPEAVGVRARQGSAERVGVHRPLPGPRARRGPAITRMVSSGVPDMPAKNVTIVDRDGNLLTQTASASGLDASQLAAGRAQHAEAHRRDPRADLRRGQRALAGQRGPRFLEARADVGKLRPERQSAAIRDPQPADQQLDRTRAGRRVGRAGRAVEHAAAAGIRADRRRQRRERAQTTPVSDRKDQTTNYEVDKTIRHLEQPMGSVKRLSVAVVVNYQPVADAKGHVTMQPLPPAKLAQVEQLVKDAMGYDAKRGDSVNVVNSAFSTASDPYADLPWWRQPDMIAMAKEAAKWLGIAAPPRCSTSCSCARRCAAFPPPEPAGASPRRKIRSRSTPAGAGEGRGTRFAAARVREREEPLRTQPRLRAHDRPPDPKIVATVVKNWVSDER